MKILFTVSFIFFSLAVSFDIIAHNTQISDWAMNMCIRTLLFMPIYRFVEYAKQVIKEDEEERARLIHRHRLRREYKREKE